MRYTKDQFKRLEEEKDLLIQIANNEHRGIIISRKQKLFKGIYREIDKSFCPGCNYSWIKRMARWFVEDMKIYESNKNNKKKNVKKEK